jgi:hypothetical protein
VTLRVCARAEAVAFAGMYLLNFQFFFVFFAELTMSRNVGSRNPTRAEGPLPNHYGIRVYVP